MVNTVIEAMHSTVHAGSSLAHQVNFGSGIKNEMESASQLADSIKQDVESNVGVMTEVSSYFENLIGILAMNELNTDDEAAIKEGCDEMVGFIGSAVSHFDDLQSALAAAMTAIDALNEGCQASTDKADEVAGMISNLASK